MACPPNIWSGLYSLYKSNIHDIGVETGTGTETETETETETNYVGLAKTGKSTHVPFLGDAPLSTKVESKKQQQALRLISAMFGPRIKFLVTGGGPTATAVRVGLTVFSFEDVPY